MLIIMVVRQEATGADEARAAAVLVTQTAPAAGGPEQTGI
jgi:hypothetical protein